ncbi:MAG: invasion expression up-regulator SirB [Gammaproteobacteria bacterium]|nr:invasion expression up-regulator SirB [Gammaproteobacteria bacterium]
MPGMIIKQLHVAFVILTFISFSVRSYWMYAGSKLLRNKVVRIVPHFIDFFLLSTGLIMAVSFYGAFYQRPWLLLKLLGVLIYIVLGSVALKRGKTMKTRIAAVFGSWLVFFYIVIMARTHAVIPY